MNRYRHIILFLLIIVSIISSPATLCSQALNNGVRLYNAVDSIFIDRTVWKGSKYSEKRSVLDRSYIGAGYGYNNMIEGDNEGSYHISYSFWAAPVHGVEVGYNSINRGRLDMNYLFNITSYAHHQEVSGKFDLIVKGGIATEFDSSIDFAKRVGFRTALRAQYRLTPTIYLYAEPSVSLFDGREIAALQGGMSINIGESVNTTKDCYTRFKRVVNDISESIDKPLFIVKTNLLFDALTVSNIEFEMPIRDKWSVAAEWNFPWWVWDDGSKSSVRNRIELLNGNIEGKYWLGDRQNQDVMTGWYAGLYTGGGLYDMEYRGEGYQGEFFIAAGLSGGYAHTLNRSGSLRMEYSLGVGYLRTEYLNYVSVYYDDNDWRAVKSKSGTYSWFGPTRLRVSLGWLIGARKKRGGYND